MEENNLLILSEIKQVKIPLMIGSYKCFSKSIEGSMEKSNASSLQRECIGCGVTNTDNEPERKKKFSFPWAFVIHLFTFVYKLPISDHMSFPWEKFKYLHLKESTPKSTVTWSEMGTTNNEGKEVYYSWT